MPTSPAPRGRRLAVVVLVALVATALMPFAGAQGVVGGAPVPPPQVVSGEAPVGGPVRFHGDTLGPGASSYSATARVGRKAKVKGKAKTRAKAKASSRAKSRAKARPRARAKLPWQSTLAWKGGVVRYTETLPPVWDWSLRQAVAQWNASGAKVTIAPAASASTAQLRIGYGAIGGSAGLATVGSTPGAFVKLSDRYRSVDADAAYYRVEVMAVLAHEIGHVLGLEHTTSSCGLMSPVLDVAGCGLWEVESPGEYRCPVMQADVVSRAAKLYGGRARTTTTRTCLVDPLPGSLSGVTLEAGDGSYTVRWTPPTSAPASSMVYISHWDGACDLQPADAALEAAWLSDRTWSRATEAPDCVQVTPVNRYGMGPAPVLVAAR